MKDLEEESALKASFCQERQKTDIILPIIIISNHQLLIGMLNYHFNHLFSFFRHAGTIYAFLFSSDIVNNLMVATLTTTLKEKFCYSGLFLIISIWGIVALIATLLYPKSPDPGRLSSSLKKREEKVGQKEYKRAPGIETEMT